VLTRAGLASQEALSRRSRAYTKLGLADRELSDDDLLDLMVTEPTLLRRPLVIGRGGSSIGFNRDQLEALIQAER
jgi:arsenate reductase-like glutaredoxin family protein